jgi:hypothetical protein
MVSSLSRLGVFGRHSEINGAPFFHSGPRRRRSGYGVENLVGCRGSELRIQHKKSTRKMSDGIPTACTFLVAVADDTGSPAAFHEALRLRHSHDRLLVVNVEQVRASFVLGGGLPHVEAELIDRISLKPPPAESPVAASPVHPVPTILVVHTIPTSLQIHVGFATTVRADRGVRASPHASPRFASGIPSVPHVSPCFATRLGR